MKHIECWISVGSTYTFLTVMRIERVCKEASIEVLWRPFSVRARMQKMDNIPFAGKPLKVKYMWRDIERRAERYGIPVNVPVEYPLQNFDLINRVALLAASENWCLEFVTAFYSRWFQSGKAQGPEPDLADVVRIAGQSPDRVLSIADSKEVHDEFARATAQAEALGIFGSPSFITGDKELFWGDDRLDDAIDWLNR